MRKLLLFIILVSSLVILVYLFFNRAPQDIKTAYFPTRTKTIGCVARGPLPDKECTPGAVKEGVTAEQICTKGYARSVRNVRNTVKKEVYRSYGITHRILGEHEVDHLVSLELGGSNDIANLWPEPADPRPGFREKDKVENYLHREVCAGKITLKDAQEKIASDWVAVYEIMKK